MPVLREKEDQNFWNFVFGIAYVVFVAASAWHVYFVRGVLPVHIPAFDFFIITLAIFRLTRLFVYDKIMRFFREWFMQKKVIQTNMGEMVELAGYPRGIRRTISELLACPWCTGVWVSLPVFYAYAMYQSWAWYAIFVLALSGAATIIQLTANLIGWQAELGKMAAQAEDNKCG